MIEAAKLYLSINKKDDFLFKCMLAITALSVAISIPWVEYIIDDNVMTPIVFIIDKTIAVFSEKKAIVSSADAWSQLEVFS